MSVQGQTKPLISDLRVVLFFYLRLGFFSFFIICKPRRQHKGFVLN